MHGRRLSSAIGAVLLELVAPLVLAGQPSTGSPVTGRTFRYADGGTAVYYQVQLGAGGPADTYVFFYGGSGCVSWRPHVPGYFDGLVGRVTVFALNKRHVTDAPGAGACGKAFASDNHPRRWVSDYMEFITGQLRQAEVRPSRIALVGVSEGAPVAAKVARSREDVTHLAIIGDGGWTMRRSLEALAGQAVVDAGWKAIAADANSIVKKWLGHPYRYWFDVMDIDPTPDYLRLSIPVLVGFGEMDESVPVASALALQDSFRLARKENFTLRVYPGADHSLVADEINHRRAFFAELSRVLQE
jgi:predicted esterase